MNEELFEWEVSVGDLIIGRTTTAGRFDLLKKAVKDGLIPEDFSMTDVKFNLVKKVS
jgi:hypothetical protein